MNKEHLIMYNTSTGEVAGAYNKASKDMSYIIVPTGYALLEVNQNYCVSQITHYIDLSTFEVKMYTEQERITRRNQ